MTPSWPILTLNGNTVVVIGVRRRSFGSDNGVIQRLRRAELTEKTCPASIAHTELFEVHQESIQRLVTRQIRPTLTQATLLL
jgi:hypothetical protein